MCTHVPHTHQIWAWIWACAAYHTHSHLFFVWVLAHDGDVGAAVNHAGLHLEDDANFALGAAATSKGGRDTQLSRRRHEAALNATADAEYIGLVEGRRQLATGNAAEDFARLGHLAELDLSAADEGDGRSVDALLVVACSVVVALEHWTGVEAQTDHL